MLRTIRPDTLPYFACLNDRLLQTPPRGIVLEFHGLGFGGQMEDPPQLGRLCAENGALYLFPYDDPWCWMNRAAIQTTDALLDAVFEKYRLDPATPIISTGGSMGGLGALIYTRYAKRTPVACAVNSPVCDLVYHDTERFDVARTVYAAFSGEPDFRRAVLAASPLHQVGSMPDIPYYIVHGDADTAVSKTHHSDIFVREMRQDHRVEYHEVPGMEHCALPEKEWQSYCRFIFHFLGTAQNPEGFPKR